MFNSLLYMITIIVWGSSWLAIKYQIGDVPVIQSVLYRFIIAAVLLLVFLLIKKRLRFYNFQAHTLFALLGGCLFGFNYFLFYKATEYGLTTGLEAVIFSFLITMNILNNAIFFRQKPDAKVIAGATVGLMGTTMLFGSDLSELANGTNIGIGVGLSVLATYLASLGNMASRQLQSMDIDVVSANMWGMTYGVLFLLITSLSITSEFKFSTESSYIISLILLAVMASIVAFWAYLTLLGRIGAERAAYVTIAFPIIALFLSCIFEDYQWNSLKTFGIVFIVFGNLIVLGKIRFSILKRISNGIISLKI